MKNSFKRAMALALAAVMIFSLAACGKSSESTAVNQTESTPEYTYAAEYKTLAGVDQDSIYLYPRAITDEGYYAISYETVSARLLDETGEVVAVETDDDSDSIYKSFLYFVSFDGTVTKLEAYEPLEAATNTEGYSNFYSSSDISGLGVTSDGRVAIIEAVYCGWSTAPEGISQYSDDYWEYYEYKEDYYIRWLNKDGSEISCAEIQVDTDNGYLNAYEMVLDNQENVVCTYNGDAIVGIKADGTLAYSIESDDYFMDLVALSGGRIGVTIYGGSGVELMLVDTEAKSFGESYPVGVYFYSSAPGSNGYDLYYTSGTNFYGVKLEEDSSPEKLFSWLACDVNSDDISKFSVLSDGTIVAITNDYDRVQQKTVSELVTVKQVPYNSVKQKTVLTLGCLYTDSYTNDMVVKFNRSSDEYRIEVVDYSEYNTDDDYSLGQTKFNTEIMAGNVPDIIATSNLNYTQLAAKGIIEDLYPYIDADSEMSRDDFFENVLKANEVDGKLCSTVAGFYISTVLGASSVVGDTPGWTYEDFNAALAAMPEGCDPFDYYTTRDGILQTCLALDMDRYVNWSTGQCNFDSEEFIELLEFAAQFPESFDWDNYDYSAENTDTKTRLAQGKQMLMATSVYSIDELFYSNYDNYFGGSYTFIGYPTAEGTGNMIGLDSGGLAMSSKSQYKDAVWQFLRMFMTEEYQSSYLWSLPSRRDVFNAQAQDAMTIEYQKDDNGNYVLDDEGEKIPMAKYSTYNDETGDYDPVYCVSQDKIDGLISLIESTDKCANYDSDIFDIVNEQAAAFFAGQKSAAEVAKLVQSKANIFVNEQR